MTILIKRWFMRRRVSELYLTNAEHGFLKMLRYFDLSVERSSGVVKSNGVLSFVKDWSEHYDVTHSMPIGNSGRFAGLQEGKFYHWLELRIPYWSEHNPLEYIK